MGLLYAYILKYNIKNYRFKLEMFENNIAANFLIRKVKYKSNKYVPFYPKIIILTLPRNGSSTAWLFTTTKTAG